MFADPSVFDAPPNPLIVVEGYPYGDQCELCGVSFTDEDAYWDHVENIHTEEEWKAFGEALIEWLTNPRERTPGKTASPEFATPISSPETSTPYGLGSSPRDW